MILAVYVSYTGDARVDSPLKRAKRACEAVYAGGDVVAGARARAGRFGISLTFAEDEARRVAG